MTKRKRPPESAAKAEESADTQTPMERFRGVTRQLLGVSRERLREEQRKYEEGKKLRAKRNPD
jgi:hypothetical protein